MPFTSTRRTTTVLRSRRTAGLIALPVAAALAIGVAPASAAAPRITDIDAELTRGGYLQLSAETRGATRVTFSWAGRTAKGYLTDTDDDGSREYERTIAAKGLKQGTHRISVRACGADGCTTRTVRTFVELDD